MDNFGRQTAEPRELGRPTELPRLPLVCLGQTPLGVVPSCAHSILSAGRQAIEFVRPSGSLGGAVVWKRSDAALSPRPLREACAQL